MVETETPPAIGAGRSWTTGFLIALAGLLVSVQLPDHARVWALACGGGLFALTVTAIVRRSPAIVRTMLAVDLVFLIFQLGGLLAWSPALTTVLVCIVPVAALLTAGRVARLRPTAPWLRVGRVTPALLGLAVATVAGSVVALTAWALTAKPQTPAYLADLKTLPVWVAVLGVLGFSLVNPIWEEALYRGVLLTELAAAVGAWPAIVMQAIVFGLAHLHGFPSGPVGVLMAGGWGLVLGIIRVRSGGIGLSYATHVCANAAIGILAAAVLP